MDLDVFAKSVARANMPRGDIGEALGVLQRTRPLERPTSPHADAPEDDLLDHLDRDIPASGAEEARYLTEAGFLLVVGLFVRGGGERGGELLDEALRRRPLADRATGGRGDAADEPLSSGGPRTGRPRLVAPGRSRRRPCPSGWRCHPRLAGQCPRPIGRLSRRAPGDPVLSMYPARREPTQRMTVGGTGLRTRAGTTAQRRPASG